MKMTEFIIIFQIKISFDVEMGIFKSISIDQNQKNFWWHKNEVNSFFLYL